MAVTIQEDFSPERSDQTSGKTVPWGSHDALITGDGQGLYIDTTDLINNANEVPSLSNSVALKADKNYVDSADINLQSQIDSIAGGVSGSLYVSAATVNTSGLVSPIGNESKITGGSRESVGLYGITHSYTNMNVFVSVTANGNVNTSFSLYSTSSIGGNNGLTIKVFDTISGSLVDVNFTIMIAGLT